MIVWIKKFGDCPLFWRTERLYQMRPSGNVNYLVFVDLSVVPAGPVLSNEDYMK